MIYWIVDTAGGDWPEYAAVYGNLETAMAAAYDLVTATESLTIDCVDSSAGGNPDTQAVTVDGWTTSADYTLTIQAHKSQRHGGVWDDSKYQLVDHASYNSVLGYSVDYLTVRGLQVENTSDDRPIGLKLLTDLTDNNNSVNILGNYVRSSAVITFASSGYGGIIISGDYADIKINNNIVVGFSYDAGNTFGIEYGTYGGTTAVENNITYDCTTGINEDYSATANLNNNVTLGGLNGFIGTPTTADHNVSSDLTAPGTNTVHSFDHSTLFPSAASGDFRPSIPYVDALGETWGAGAIPWQRDVVVDTSESYAYVTEDFSVDLSGFTRVSDSIDATVSGGELVGVSGDTWVSYNNSATFSINHYSKITSKESGTYIIGPAVRVSAGASAENCYALIQDTTNYRLIRKDNGVTNNLLSEIGSPWAYNDVLHLEAVGTVLLCYVNNILIGSAVDSTYATGSPGIFTYNTSHGDDWFAGDAAHYSNLASAEAGEQVIGDNLALRNEKMIISCTSGGTTTADTTAVTIDANWLTSETCDFTVQGDWNGSEYSDTEYNLNSNSSSNDLTINVSYVYIDSMQLYSSIAASGKNIYLDGASHCTINGCFGSTDGTDSNAGGFMAVNSSDYITMTNNVLVGCRSACSINNSNFPTVVNNTYYNNDYGFFIPHALVGEVHNNIVFNCGSAIVPYPSNLTYTNNIGDASLNGTDGYENITIYDAAVDTLPVVPEDCVIFKDIAGNDFRLVSHFVEDYTGTMVETNSAISNGTWLYDVAEDSAGKSREPYDFKGVRTARPFDIGAWQAPAQLTYVVDTDGVSGDYSGLAVAFAGLQADSTDLVADNLLPTISCQASSSLPDTVPLRDINGISSSIDNKLTISGGGISPLGFDYSKYVYENVGSSGNLQFSINADLVDFQLNYTGASYWATLSWATGITVNYTRVRCKALGDAQGIYHYLGDGITSDCISEVENGYAFYERTDDVRTMSNCTAYVTGTGDGFYDNSADNLTIENCISINTGSGTDFLNVVGTNNISSDLTGDITGLTSDYFTDAANGDFTPVASAGDLMTYGASANSTVTVGAIPFVWEANVDGLDYGSLAAWDVDAVSEAVSGETVRANCSEIEDTDDVTLTAYPAGVNIEIIGDNDTGVWDDTKYRLVVSTTGVRLLTPECDNITIKNIQQNSTTGGNGNAGIRNLSAINNLVIDGVISKGTDYFFYTSEINTNFIFTNLIIYDCAVNAVTDSTALGTMLCKNCTISAGTDCYDVGSGVIIVNNALVAPIISDGTFSSVSSNNVTSNAEAIGLNPTINQDFTGDFVSATDFHTTDSPYELWGADAAYAGAFGDEPYEVGILVDTDGVTVSPISGVNHPSLSNAVSWFQTNRDNLVTRNEKALINCQASTSALDTTAVIVSGIATSATNNVTIFGEGIGADSKWDETKYVLDKLVEGDYTLSVGISNLYLGQMQIRSSGSYNSRQVLRTSVDITNKNIVIDGVYCKMAGTGGTNGVCFSCSHDSYAAVVISNCIAESTLPIAYGYSASDAADGNTHIFNSIFYGGDTGTSAFYGWTGRMKSINCIAAGTGTGFGVLYAGSSNNIATDLTGDIQDTAANLFVDAAGGDFRLKSTATNAIGGGVDLSAEFTTDITGATRELPWDIGAFSYVDLGGGITLVVNNLTGETTLSTTSIDHAYDLTVASLAGASLLPQLTFLVGFNLIVQDLVSAASLDNVTSLVAKYNISLADLVGSGALSQPALTSKYNISVADLAGLAGMDEVSLAHSYDLAVASLTGDTSLDNLSVSSAYILAMHDLLAAGVASNIDLSAKLTLVMHDLAGAASVGNIALSHAYMLQIADLLGDSDLGNLVLSFATFLELNDLTGNASLSIPQLLSAYNLVVQNAIGDAALSSPSLSSAYALLVDSLAGSASMTDIELSFATLLNLSDLTSSALISPVALSSAYLLQVQELTSDAILSSLTLTQWAELVVQDLQAGSILSEVSLSNATLLVVDDLGNQSTISNIAISDVAYSLTLADLLADSSVVKVNLVLPADGYMLIIRAKNTKFSIQGDF